MEKGKAIGAPFGSPALNVPSPHHREVDIEDAERFFRSVFRNVLRVLGPKAAIYCWHRRAEDGWPSCRKTVFSLAAGATASILFASWASRHVGTAGKRWCSPPGE